MLEILMNIWNFIVEHPNWIAPFIAAGGTVLAGVLGVWMRKPLEEQALRVTTFQATIEGFQMLVKTQAAHILYLENKDQIRSEYEDDLVERLRRCEDRRSKSRDKGIGYDSHC